MSVPFVIENARLLDPATNRDQHGAIFVENGRIVDIVPGRSPGAPELAEVYDAEGAVVAPGLIDMRVFTGEPGHEYRETLASAADAAAAGGVTSFVLMPDTMPTIDDGALVDFIIRRAKATAKVNVLPAAAITKGLNGSQLTEFGLLKQAGAICLSDGRNSIPSSALLRSAFSYAANYGLPIIHQPFDHDLAGEGVMNEGLLATTLGLKGIPNEAETVPLARDLQLARLTGARYHAAQVSTAYSVELLADAKQRGSGISAGVSINNLALNENDVGAYRTFYKLSPPLRAEDDRQAMIEGLRNGTIDVIHSGHDPQDTEGKRQPFAEATDGAIGLETLLSAALRLVHSGEVSLMTVLRAMTIRPAEILGLRSGRIQVGAPADFIVFDPDYPWVVEEASIRSKSRNTAFEGARMQGKVIHTFVGGRPVYSQPQILSGAAA